MHTVDEVSLTYHPNDIDDTLMPIKIVADGNCLPRTGSMIAFGHENCHEEIRSRIILEQCNNDDVYLNPNHLRKGVDTTDREASLLRIIACTGVLESGKVHTNYRHEIINTYSTGC